MLCTICQWWSAPKLEKALFCVISSEVLAAVAAAAAVGADLPRVRWETETIVEARAALNDFADD